MHKVGALRDTIAYKNVQGSFLALMDCLSFHFVARAEVRLT